MELKVFPLLLHGLLLSLPTCKGETHRLLPAVFTHFLSQPKVSSCSTTIFYDEGKYEHILRELLDSNNLRDRPISLYTLQGALANALGHTDQKACQFYLHLTDLCDEYSIELIQTLFENKFFNSLATYFHVFWMDKYPSRTCEEEVIKFLPNSLYITQSPESNSIIIKEFTTDGFWNDVGYYSDSLGFHQYYPNLFEINDCTRRIVAAYLSMDQPLDPYNYTGNFANAQIWPTTSFLARYSKLDFEFVERKDNVYGLPGKNGSFTGMVGMLERGEIDFVFGPMGYNRYRDGVADYTAYHFTTSSVFYRKKSGFLPKWQAVMWPFDNISWAIVVGLIVVTGFSYILIVTVTGAKADISGCLLNTVSIFLGEGYKIQIGVVSEYILLLFWIMYSFIILTGYGGLLKSCLVSLERQKSVENLEGIYNSKAHERVGLWIGGFMHGYYKSSASKDLRGIIKEKTLVHIETAAEGFSALHEGKLDILFQNDKDTMLIIDRYQSLYQSHSFDYHYRRFIVRNNSRFMSLINNGLQRYIASGLNIQERQMVRTGLQKIQKIRNPGLYLDTTDGESYQLKALTINDLQGGFWLLIIGCFFSIVACILENIFLYRSRKKVIRIKRKEFMRDDW